MCYQCNWLVKVLLLANFNSYDKSGQTALRSPGISWPSWTLHQIEIFMCAGLLVWLTKTWRALLVDQLSVLFSFYIFLQNMFLWIPFSLLSPSCRNAFSFVWCGYYSIKQSLLMCQLPTTRCSFRSFRSLWTFVCKWWLLCLLSKLIAVVLLYRNGLSYFIMLFI